MSLPLAGCRVLVTRERPGELAVMLAVRGAVVLHVPLIVVADPVDGGRDLVARLAQLDDVDWLVVTSAAGAERVGDAVAAAPGVRLAAVGTATAKVLADRSGRDVDLVPAVQRGAALASELSAACPRPQRILIAQADIAEPTLTSALRDAGHEVTNVVAYRTLVREPDADDRDAVATADAVVFASGSAVDGWCRAFGPTTPPIAVGIGPTTAAAAERFGLKLSGVAADHTLDGLVTELERVWADDGPRCDLGSPRPR